MLLLLLSQSLLSVVCCTFFFFNYFIVSVCGGGVVHSKRIQRSNCNALGLHCAQTILQTCCSCSSSSRSILAHAWTLNVRQPNGLDATAEKKRKWNESNHETIGETGDVSRMNSVIQFSLNRFRCFELMWFRYWPLRILSVCMFHVYWPRWPLQCNAMHLEICFFHTFCLCSKGEKEMNCLSIRLNQIDSSWWCLYELFFCSRAMIACAYEIADEVQREKGKMVNLIMNCCRHSTIEQQKRNETQKTNLLFIVNIGTEWNCARRVHSTI